MQYSLGWKNWEETLRIPSNKRAFCVGSEKRAVSLECLVVFRGGFSCMEMIVDCKFILGEGHPLKFDKLRGKKH